jgi:hypothetical protein
LSRRGGKPNPSRFVFLLALTSSCAFDFNDFDVSPAPPPPPTAVTPPSELRLAGFKDPPRELRVPRGGKRTLTLKIDRAGDINPITISLANLPLHVTANPITIDPSASEATIEIAAAFAATPGKTDVELKAQLLSHPVALTITSAALDPSFGVGGIATGEQGAFEDLAIDEAGLAHVLVSTPTTNTFSLLRESNTGRLDDILLDRRPGNPSPLRLALQAKGAAAVALGTTTGLKLFIKKPQGEFSAEFIVQAAGANPHVARSSIAGAGANMHVLTASSGRLTIFSPGVGGSLIDALAVTKLDMDGVADPTFGLDARGRAYVGVNPGDEARDLLIGKRGYLVCATTKTGILLTRFLAATGSLDGGFGTAGGVMRHDDASAISASATNLSCRSLAFEDASDEERVLVTGETTVGSVKKSFVMRILADGKRDTSFGTNGFLTFGPDNAIAQSIDGKFVAGTLADRSRAFVFHMNDDLFGADDGTSFVIDPIQSALGTDGRVVKVDPSSASSSGARRILVGGRTTLPGKEGWFVARILLP